MIIIFRLCGPNRHLDRQKTTQSRIPGLTHNYIYVIPNRAITTEAMVSSLPFILLALGSSISARPNLQRRGLPGAVYICDGMDFRGNCQWNAPSDRCIIQGPAGSGVVSMGPDPDGKCILFEKSDCTGQVVETVRFPGYVGGLPTFASFRCEAYPQISDFGTADVAVKALDPLADARLAGGVGSAERKRHEEEIKKMEEDGFSEGLIGLLSLIHI